MAVLMSSEVKPQHMLALEKANRIRMERADLLRRMYALNSHDGALRASEYIQDPPDVLAGMTVADLLGRIRRFGPTSIRRVCGRAEGCWATRDVRGVTLGALT